MCFAWSGHQDEPSAAAPASTTRPLRAPTPLPRGGCAPRPAPPVPPSFPARSVDPRDEFARALVEAELRDLETLEDSPHLIALLDEAMRNDRPRALAFVRRILDPDAHLPIEAIALLDRTSP